VAQRLAVSHSLLVQWSRQLKLERGSKELRVGKVGSPRGFSRLENDGSGKGIIIDGYFGVSKCIDSSQRARI
jgi:hypothetical protein